MKGGGYPIDNGISCLIDCKAVLEEDFIDNKIEKKKEKDCFSPSQMNIRSAILQINIKKRHFFDI